jgi:hypothetical protein
MSGLTRKLKDRIAVENLGSKSKIPKAPAATRVLDGAFQPRTADIFFRNRT